MEFLFVGHVSPGNDECKLDKLERIGHVQKRVGSRLRKLKNAKKGMKLQDGKGLVEKILNCIFAYLVILH